MKFTCLSEGKGYHFPACHILCVSGFRILFDFPLDLSALTVFSPIPIEPLTKYHEEKCPESFESTQIKRRKIEKSLVADDLIHAEPYFKTIKTLQSWNISFIDIVLISSPMGMLGLPFLTRNKGFTAKIYVTDAAARLGQLMMEDLVAMHKELRLVYGPGQSGGPQWMKWNELEFLPVELKEVILGKDGTDFGGWMPLYSADDVKECLHNVRSLKYGEEVCYNGTLLIKGLSSGLEIGSCNWSITTPKGKIVYLSSSIFTSEICMNFDFLPLQGSDVFLYSDFTITNKGNIEDDIGSSSLVADDSSENDEIGVVVNSLANTAECTEETEKLSFLCSCALDSVKSGGSVLVSIGRIGIMIQLLEQIAVLLESSDLEVPIFVISSVAEELLAVSNIIPEWLSKQRQDRLYSGQPLFAHVELLKRKRVHLFPEIHSCSLLKMWQEPCVIFCPHWSLRIGPVVHFLQRWCGDPNSLLVMEEGVDPNLSLLPFSPMEMKVVQCSFLSGIASTKIKPLMKILQPTCVLFPEKMGKIIGNLNQSSSMIYYSENQTVLVPKPKSFSELNIAVELASLLQCANIGKEDLTVARLKGELSVERGQYHLLMQKEQALSSQKRPLLYFGRVDINLLEEALKKMGVITAATPEAMDTSPRSENVHMLQVLEPVKALIEVTESETVVSTSDEFLAARISEAVRNILYVV
ncbi:hypothetical protein Leryth_003815 [Lithospermum erythrorhizon]|nr:hypothetical protein Leryth_003815 [Lithospermum erythrorhizon]